MIRKIRLKSIILLIFLVFTINLTGCIERKKGINITNRDSLVYNLEKFPRDLLMLNNENIREKDLLFALFEGLVREGENNIEPALAEDWTISNDRIQYEFKIRPEAAWSTGEKITARDFEDFFKYILREGKNNYFIKELKCIYGAEAYMKNTCNFDDVAIKSSEDNKTLIIRLNTPCPYLLSILSHPLLTLRDKNHSTDSYFKEYKNIKYSGPFVIDNLEEKNSIDMIKNNYYWEKEKVPSENLTFMAIEEGEEALISFESYLYDNKNLSKNKDNLLDKLTGKKVDENKSEDYRKKLSDIDIIANPPRNEVSRLSEKNFIEIHDCLKTLDLVFNLKEGNICRNIDLRKAIKNTLSKNIVKDLLDDENAKVCNGIIPSINNNRRGEEIGKRNYLDSNLEEAKKYFKKINLKDKNNYSIKLVCAKNMLDKLLCKNIKEEIEKFLEIKVDILNYDYNEFKVILKDGKYDMALVEFQGNYDDPICFLNHWKENGYANFTSYKNSQFELLTNKAIYENDMNKKYDNIYKAEEILFNDIPLIPIFNFNTVICKREYVKDLIVTKCGNIRFNRAYKSITNS